MLANNDQGLEAVRRAALLQRRHGRPADKPSEPPNAAANSQAKNLHSSSKTNIGLRVDIFLRYVSASRTGDHRETDASQRPGGAEPSQQSALWLRAHDLRKQA